MVVIKECFPSRADFISDYLSKRRQQLEILQQRKFKLSFVPREDEKITPLDQHHDLCLNEATENLDHTKIQTPLIVPVHDEPKYVKNFNAFIEQTHQHLNRVLANKQKIDDVHGIVTKIQEQPIQPRKLATLERMPEFGREEVNSLKDIPKHTRRLSNDLELDREQIPTQEAIPKQTGRVTNNFSPRESVKSKQSEDSEHTSKSQTSSSLSFSSRTTSSTLSSRSKISTKSNASKSSLTKDKNLTTRSEVVRTKCITERKTTNVVLSSTRSTKVQALGKKSVQTSLQSSTKSMTSRTLTLPGSASRSSASGSVSRRSTNNTARSEASIWKEKRMAPIPVSVINLQL